MVTSPPLSALPRAQYSINNLEYFDELFKMTAQAGHYLEFMY